MIPLPALPVAERGLEVAGVVQCKALLHHASKNFPLPARRGGGRGWGKTLSA
jgi:hypothetical protein